MLLDTWDEIFINCEWWSNFLCRWIFSGLLLNNKDRLSWEVASFKKWKKTWEAEVSIVWRNCTFKNREIISELCIKTNPFWKVMHCLPNHAWKSTWAPRFHILCYFILLLFCILAFCQRPRRNWTIVWIINF